MEDLTKEAMSRNYQQFFAICKAVGKEYKDAVMEFTNGRTDSLRALDDGEFKELMLRVRTWQPNSVKVFVPPVGDGQRKKLIAIAGKMHWGNTVIEIVGRLNAWSESNYSKELNELDVNTLNKMVWVFENKIYKEYLKKV